ncbi:hypothetical protein N878_07855 [Pseudomonas sp. EGD-AK9]|nr:hypothetical protein N878_07855 [Pseudomonas sp. EGD-AK9]
MASRLGSLQSLHLALFIAAQIYTSKDMPVDEQRWHALLIRWSQSAQAAALVSIELREAFI